MLLWRYLVGKVLWRLGVALLALCLVYLLFDLGDQGRVLAAQLGWTRVLLASLLHLPLVAVQVLPAALLLAGVLALGCLRRGGELEALQAAGSGPGLLAAALLSCGLGCTALGWALGEWLAPPLEHRADALLRYQRASPLTGQGSPPRWVRSGDWLLSLQPRPAGQLALLALELDAQFVPRRRIDAQVASLAEGRLASGQQRRFEAGRAAAPVPAPTSLAVLRELAPLWSSRQLRAESLSTPELWRLVGALRLAGQPAIASELLLHSRLSYPLVNLLVGVMLLGFAGRPRGASVARQLAAGLGLLCGLWLGFALGWAAARLSWLPPAAGAWLPLIWGALLSGAAWLGAVRRPAARRAMAVGRRDRG